jgi:regulator of PEP synthase PpsR (kinase-PPPase family)
VKENGADSADVVPVFFLSDSTGISAETMGNAMLIQFPDLRFERTLIPFISSVEDAQRVVAQLDATLESSPRPPLVFATAASDEVRLELLRTRCPIIDFFGLHMERVEAILDAHGVHAAARLHGVGDIKRYNSRMQAVEYTIEHDDGQSVRSLEKADVILLAPSRCGKTPTAMYLALQHGLFVANYPIVPEDLESNELPSPVRSLRDRCFGLTTTPQRLSAVRQERRPDSRYASLDQCTYELRRTEAIFQLYDLPVVDSSTRSVEEISTVVLQGLKTMKGSQDPDPARTRRPR